MAIVESELVGSQCSYHACMPAKALLRPAQALPAARQVHAPPAVQGDLDANAVLAHRDVIVSDFDDAGQLPWLERRGVKLIRGHGRLEGERRVSVGGESYAAAPAVVIAVRSAAALPPIPGLAAATPWTSREVTTTKRIPGRLLIPGGSVTGVKMADAFTSLGSKVTVIEAEERLSRAGAVRVRTAAPGSRRALGRRAAWRPRRAGEPRREGRTRGAQRMAPW